MDRQYDRVKLVNGIVKAFQDLRWESRFHDNNRWRHVRSADNPADCASRGLFPSELVDFALWWKGPTWLTKSQSQWPVQFKLPPNSDEDRELCLVARTNPIEPILPVNRYSTFTRLQRVLAWVFRFIHNCRRRHHYSTTSGCLTVDKLHQAERYWIQFSQGISVPNKLSTIRLTPEADLFNNSSLKSLCPFLDVHGMLCVGGRTSNAELAYSTRHPIVPQEILLCFIASIRLLVSF